MSDLSVNKTKIKKSAKKPSLIGFVAIVAVIIAWWIASQFTNPIIFPGPVATVSAIVEIFSTQLVDLAITFGRYVLALSIAILAGWLVGLLMGASRRLIGEFMQPIILIVQAVPSLSWILLAVLWFTSVELRITWVTFMVSFPFFAIAVYEGIRDMDKDMLEAVEQFCPSRLQVIRILLVPQSIVNLIMATRATAAISLKILVFSELVGANNGVGQALNNAQNSFRIDLIFGWSVILIIINFVLIRGVVNFAEKRILKWRAEAVVR